MIFLILLFTLNLFTFQEFELPEGKWWRNEEVIKDIGLTDEQQRNLEKIFFEHLENVIDLRAKVEKEELKLRQLLDQEKIQEKEVLNQVDKLLDARKEMERARAELFLKVRMILKPEQWAKIKSKYKKKMKAVMERKRYQHFQENFPPESPSFPPEK